MVSREGRLEDDDEDDGPPIRRRRSLRAMMDESDADVAAGRVVEGAPCWQRCGRLRRGFGKSGWHVKRRRGCGRRTAYDWDG